MFNLEILLLSPFHSAIPSQKKLCLTELDLQYAVIMDFESTTQICDSLLDIKETILDWDDGLLQNNNLREMCNDIYKTCCTSEKCDSHISRVIMSDHLHNMKKT